MRQTHDVEHPRRRGWAGLVGLLAVLVIMLILMIVSGGSGGGYLRQSANTRQQAQAMRAQIDMQQVATMVAQYHLQHDEYPSTLAEAGLDALPQFRGELGARARLRVVDERGSPKRVEIVRPGPDGELDTEDDLTESATLPF
ncbi:MAG: hypothetical protein AAGK04_02520 [Planctomycetota bacterium]